MPFPALPLNTPSRSSTINKHDHRSGSANTTPTPASKHPASASNAPGPGLPDISSPHELTVFVETLLEQLDTKFDEMSTQILDRMTQMSTRVDALEASIQDIISSGDSTTGSMSMPQSPIPASFSIRRGS